MFSSLAQRYEKTPTYCIFFQNYLYSSENSLIFAGSRTNIKQIKMKRILIALFVFCATYVQAQDLIVTKEGESLKVYNVDMGGSAVFYQLSDDEGAEIQRMPKADVLLIKKADGTKIDLTAPDGGAYEAAPTASGSRQHDAVTATASSALTKGKKGVKTFSAKTPDGKELNYMILSEADHTLAVAEGEYGESEYIIPDYVELEGVKYTVTEIAEKAFLHKNSIRNIVFPSTLKKIGKRAFAGSCLERIILPESIEIIEDRAFTFQGWNGRAGCLVELYIPVTIKNIGDICFMYSGRSQSPRGYYQGYITCMPPFISEGTCKQYGIDEEAVRAYYRSK